MIYKSDIKVRVQVPAVSYVNKKIKRHGFFYKFYKVAFVLLFLCFIPAQKSYACCWACGKSDCNKAVEFIQEAHMDIRDRVKTEFDHDLEMFHQWLAYMQETEFNKGVGDMLTQLGSVAMQYTMIIGSFLDAQNQMDTQRLFRKLQFQAHKDYRPSEGFCTFGTNVKSLAGSDSIARFNSLALSNISLARQLGTMNTAGAMNQEQDYRARWGQFVKTYCDPRDNNRISPTTGLERACDWDGPDGGGKKRGGEDRNRFNRDLDYTRLIDEPRTLNIDFADNILNVDDDMQPLEAMIGTGAGITVGGLPLPLEIEEPGDEEDVIAMSKNLYGHKVLSRGLLDTVMRQTDAQSVYLALRSVAAKRSVAQASFNAIVGLKSSGVSHEQLDEFASPASVGVLGGLDPLVSAGSLIQKQSRRFLAAIVDQLLPQSTLLGVGTGGNIFDLIGYSPSYYSQLEILAKRIYQNPDFYADLYDTPVNVSRKKVAMQAIDLMVDRAIYESQLRREMNVSVLLSSKLRAAHREANANILGSAD